MIERAPFGNTGHESTRVIFGSAGLGFVGQERADQVLPVLLGHGVNHIDTAAAYGDAELRLAPWLAAHPASSSSPPRPVSAPPMGHERVSSVRSSAWESTGWT